MDESMFSAALGLPNPSLFNKFMEGLMTAMCVQVWEKQECLTENLESQGMNLVLLGLEIEDERSTKKELDGSSCR